MPFQTPFNVIAAFDREATARAAADRLVRQGVPSSALRVRARGQGDGDELAEQRAEMQDELVESWPSLSLMTTSQAKGALAGTAGLAIAGAALGALVGLGWAIGFESTLSPAVRILLAAVLGGIGGSTVGFIAGGGLEPRRTAAGDPTRMLDDQRTPAERDVLVAVHTGERSLAENVAEGLSGSGAERVHLVDREGTPLPPQSEHPRPADPEGWWWQRAGSG